MGVYILDQYFYLHFAVGIIAYFWNISLLHFFIIHTIFEILENTKTFMYIINNYILAWPGGKQESDTIINNIGDTIGAMLGWYSAYYLDKLGNKYNFYNLHIK